ncbi:MAG: M28 family peptidase [Lentisphaerae bacterium]|nr:M28 family peptidase [Lentisphaerota bacterium]
MRHSALLRPAAGLVPAALLAGLTACAPPDNPAPDRRTLSAPPAERLFAEVADFVALGPRHSGTPGAERAAAYIAGRLASLGYAPQTDVFTDDTPAGALVFRNVTAELPAPHAAETVILVSHYDTKAGIAPGFTGANDSGSSTGLLLALAGHLQDAPPLAFNLRFAFLDGEECLDAYGPRDGLHGSRRLARRLVESGDAGRVRAVVVLDMIGDRDLSVTIPRNGTPALVSAVFRAAHAEGVRRRFALAPFDILDDHVPFREAGMPAVNLIDFAYGSAPGLNDYWHTPEDTLDKLSPDSLHIVCRVVLRLLASL